MFGVLQLDEKFSWGRQANASANNGAIRWLIYFSSLILPAVVERPRSLLAMLGPEFLNLFMLLCWASSVFPDTCASVAGCVLPKLELFKGIHASAPVDMKKQSPGGPNNIVFKISGASFCGGLCPGFFYGVSVKGSSLMPEGN